MSLYSVFCFTVELFDSEILLDGLEKDFIIPSCPVQFCDIFGRSVENIRKDCDFVSSFFIYGFYDLKRKRTFSECLYPGKSNRLVKSYDLVSRFSMTS